MGRYVPTRKGGWGIPQTMPNTMPKLTEIPTRRKVNAVILTTADMMTAVTLRKMNPPCLQVTLIQILLAAMRALTQAPVRKKGGRGGEQGRKQGEPVKGQIRDDGARQSRKQRRRRKYKREKRLPRKYTRQR
jgi:hypothetical protein